MNRILEATLAQLKRKQQSVTRLFPDFFSNPIKVPGVIDKGGVRMDSMEGDTWNFRIHSGSEEGTWYDAHVRWKNIVPTIQNLVADRRNWNRAKTKVDLRKLSAKMFAKADVELDCSCPADLFWGKQYIRSQDKYRAKYGEPENRPPDVRNPKKYGAFCKHIQVLMRVLPFYKSTMANWIKREHGDVITAAEEQARAEAEQFRATGRELGRRRRPRESICEAKLGPLSAEMKKQWGRAKKSEMFQTSTYPNEEQYVKFWLLADGTFIHVPKMHLTQMPRDEYRKERLFDEGAVRISSEPNGEMDLEYCSGEVSDVQYQALINLARLHGTTKITTEGDELSPAPVRSPSDIPKIMRGEVEKEPSLAAQFHESIKGQNHEDKTTVSNIKTSSPAIVSAYHGAQHPVSGKLKGITSELISDPESGVLWLTDSIEDARDFSELYGSEDPVVYQVEVSVGNPVVVNYQGEEYDPGHVGDLIRDARKKQHDSLVIQNVRSFDYSEPSNYLLSFDGEAVIVKEISAA
jgi:hypothetical protein